MEDYDKFVQHRLSQLRKREEEQSPASPASSLIRFYGRSILPPLLSGEQRLEMQRQRYAAMTSVAHRKLKNDPRLAYVQTILHSVQLRKTPTLEELLQESEISTKSSYYHNISDAAVSQNNISVERNESLKLLPPPVRKRKDSVFPPLMTSTTYGAFFTSDVTPQQSHHEGCLNDRCDSQQGSQPSSLNGVNHQSISSGYTTSENVENTLSVSGRTYQGSQSHAIDSSDGVEKIGGFFLHNTLSTIAKMPDIISYPPIDGEELEKSGLESSFSNNFIGVKDIFCTSFQEDSVLCNLPESKSESNLEGTEVENVPLSTTLLDHDSNHTSDITEVSVSENNSSRTLSTHGCPTPEQHIQHDPKEIEPADSFIDEAEPAEEPYRLSLQALLKKSQEYRRRQRMLRNLAKNTKIQEKTQDQPGVRVEEQNLSDKENDEFHYKGIVTAEGKKSKERRGSFIPILETSAKKYGQNGRMIESEFIGKKIHLKSEDTGDGKADEMLRVEEDTTYTNNKLNSSQEVIKEPKSSSTVSSENSLVEEAFYLTTSPSSFYKGEGKYRNIPAPNLCTSPVCFKSRGSIKNREVDDGAENVVNTGLNEDHKKDEENTLGHQNIHPVIASHVSLMIEGDVTNALAKSSQHIDQLESSLSNLKVLISDLESTVKENLENHGQTESNAQSVCSCKGIEYSEPMINDQNLTRPQTPCDYLENMARGSCDSRDAKYRDWAKGQSFDSCKIAHEDTRTKPSFSDIDDVSLIVQGKGTEREHISELKLVKTITAQKNKENRTGKEGLNKNHGSRKQQPTAKCIFSVNQQMHIPNIFRKCPSETTVPCNVSVLSDTSNHPVERQNELTVEGRDSSRSPSLNQSYDVDTPSDLWLVDGSGFGFDSASKGHLSQENLTSESGGEAQGEVTKVKRRLLMHTTEERQEKSLNTRGCAGSVVRPNSSTPRAAVWGYGGHSSQKDKQEQLKQVHTAQIRALQDEHRRQQEELLQALAMRYHLLQSVSFPCSMSASRPQDTLTFSTPSQPSSPFSGRYRPLLSAAVKGFLTRRLLRTERVAQLVRTIRDTQQFLHVFQQQSPTSRQDLVLQERVNLQLRAARYEVYDIFFSLSATERMQLISWDRELARDRELRRQGGHTGQPRGKSSLSAATQKSLERKRRLIIQKKASEKPQGVVTITRHKTGFSAEQPLETKRGQFRAKPHRHPKSTYSTRPR
ncbi:hypothetical protein Q5P01_026262 [Channa striata]|uniref:Centriolar coiled-coil protein of 110 kDa n=1 Tax=Channa striata TaxID=64152 RepID=A0AA88J280_CHASR|nr:hypothetical protein Q5P01_026262 [Channa striata]